MAEQPKEIRNRIRSVTSTKKITRTMELVATSKMKRAQERVNAALPYSQKLEELMGELAQAATSLDEPLLQSRDQVDRVRIFLITANRGLCGGYNANVVKACKQLIAEKTAQGKNVQIDVCGKKGIGTLTYQGYKIERKYTELGDKPSYDDAIAMMEPLKRDFLEGSADEVYIVYTHWVSAATQIPAVKQVLPVQRPSKIGEEKGGTKAEYLFDPEPAVLLAQLLPMYLTQTMYTCIVEAIAGEQVARRTAMKSATDNASDMITNLTRTLNRARQAQITQEIAELVGGAEALKK